MYSGVHALPHVFLIFFNPGGFILLQEKNHRLSDDTFIRFRFPTHLHLRTGYHGCLGPLDIWLFCYFV